MLDQIGSPACDRNCVGGRDDVCRYLPTVTGEAWIDTIVDSGEQFDIAGKSQGNDVFYLRGGQLTNTGNSVPQALRYVDAPEGNSTISGTSDYGFQADGPGYLLIRSGATLRKQGSNTVTLPGTPITNEGTLLVHTGTLQLENGADITGQGTLQVNLNGTLTTSTDVFDREVEIDLPTTKLNQGLLHVLDGQTIISGELNLSGTSELRTDGNLIHSGTIMGGGAIRSTGPGTLFLSGIGLTAAGAQVSVGSLIVLNTDASATGPGNVLISDTGLFGGFGKVDGNMFSFDTATVAPGVSESSLGSPPVPFDPGVVVDAIDFDFTGMQNDVPLTQTSTLSDALQLVSGLDVGPGLIRNAGNEFNVSNFTGGTDWSNSAAAKNYVTFTVAPVVGLALQLDDVTFEFQRNDVGAARRFRIFTSIGGFGAWNAGLAPLQTNLAVEDLSVRTLTGRYTGSEIVAEPLEVRLYGWDADAKPSITTITKASLDASFVSDPNNVTLDPTGILELGGNYTQLVACSRRCHPNSQQWRI